MGLDWADVSIAAVFGFPWLEQSGEHVWPIYVFELGGEKFN